MQLGITLLKTIYSLTCISIEIMVYLIRPATMGEKSV